MANFFSKDMGNKVFKDNTANKIASVISPMPGNNLETNLLKYGKSTEYQGGTNAPKAKPVKKAKSAMASSGAKSKAAILSKAKAKGF